VGALYQWAQTLAGLTFPGEEAFVTSKDAAAINGEIVVDEEVCAANVGAVVDALRSRLTARLHLQSQLASLARAKTVQVELTLPEPALQWLPSPADARPAGKIRNWASVEWEQYCALDVTRHLVKTGAVGAEDFFYRMQVRKCVRMRLHSAGSCRSTAIPPA